METTGNAIRTTAWRAAWVAALAFALVLPLQAQQPARAAPLPADSVYQLPVTLTSHSGTAFPWRGLRGKPRIVAMFYTSCQYICPLIVEAAKAVDAALTPQQRARIGVVLISMDPVRDGPAALDRVVRERRIDTGRWILAAPAPAEVRNVAAVLDVRYRQLADGEFNHTSALVLLDADGRIAARTEKMGGVVDPAFLAAVLRLLGD